MVVVDERVKLTLPFAPMGRVLEEGDNFDSVGMELDCLTAWRREMAGTEKREPLNALKTAKNNTVKSGY